MPREVIAFFIKDKTLPAKQQVSVTLAQVYRLLANQAVGAITASSIGSIRDPNTPALMEIMLADATANRGGAYPLYARLVYPSSTEDRYFPEHLVLTSGRSAITTNRRSAVVSGSGGKVADYEVVATSAITQGTWPDGFVVIGGTISIDLKFEAPPPPAPTPYHTFSLVCGSRSGGFVGFWHSGNPANQMGTMTDRVYTLPNGNSTQIRQFMVGGSITSGKVRYLFGQTRYQADQFPTRIVAVNGSNTLVLTKPDPATIISAGQGNGLDFDVESGSIASTFNNGETINVEIYY